jgi:hypothetical protein
LNFFLFFRTKKQSSVRGHGAAQVDVDNEHHLKEVTIVLIVYHHHIAMLFTIKQGSQDKVRALSSDSQIKKNYIIA